MPRNYRVGIIGRTGKGDYGHGLAIAWRNLENVEVVAVADDDEKGLAAATARYKFKPEQAFADYREMLAKAKPNIVTVAARWPDAHKEMVVACAEAGASVFLEKPMCRDLEEADAMVAACERSHVKVAIAHQTRYGPRVARVKEMIAAGKLGELVELRGLGKWDARAGGQDLMVLGTHVMDLMRFIAGDARWCFADIRQAGKPAGKDDVKPGAEGIGPILGDDIHAIYRFDNGVRGSFTTRRDPASKGARFGLTILGTKGIVQLGFGSLGDAWFLPDPTWFPGKTKAAWQEITSAGVGEPEPLKDGGLDQGNIWIVKDLLEAIEKDRQPLGGLYDARAALEMIMAVYDSHRLQAPVDLPLKNRKHPLTML